MPADTGPSSEDEQRRLALLRASALIDGPAEERFDRITRTAARLLDFPIVIVNLVDDTRQWAKSAVGFEHGAEAPRAISFCARVVDRREPVLVPETREDARFADNPMVVEDPKLRSYFGFPVRGPQDVVFGTLCVADVAPRELDADQLALLEDLSGWVEAEFDRRSLAASSLRERSARDRIEAITAAVPDGIVVLDRRGVVVTANPAAERLAELPDGGLVGRRVEDLLIDDPAARDALVRLLAVDRLRETQRLVVEIRRRDGTPRSLELAVSSLADDPAFVLVARDVTERRAVERLKSEFVSTVSHELRTPLTSIKGTLALVVGGVTGQLPEEAASLLGVAHDNTDRLIRLVNDILDLERLASGRIELERERTDVASLVRAAVGNVQGIADAADVRLEVDVPASTVDVDGDRIVQALTNLIGNAVKFSPPGDQVEVTGEVSGGQVRLRVRDHGRGIPPELLDRVFERFAQVDASDSKVRGGSGLGLPIALGLVERHGGRLWAESVLGAGATFHLVLPVAGEGA